MRGSPLRMLRHIVAPTVAAAFLLTGASPSGAMGDGSPRAVSVVVDAATGVPSATSGDYGFVRTIADPTANSGRDVQLVPPVNGSGAVEPGHLTHTVIWSPTYLTNWPATRAAINRFATDGFNGFVADYDAQQPHDDFLNGGVGRLAGSGYRALYRNTRRAVALAAAHGMTDVFWRINADVYAPSHTPGSIYRFDIFDDTQVARFQQTFRNDARWARATGMRGIWLDMEPYDDGYYWRQEQDPAAAASRYTPDEVRVRYASLGRLAMSAMLAEDPTIQVIMAPGFESDPAQYLHYPDFYAGMASAAAQVPRARGLVIATEAGYGVDNLYSFNGIYCTEEGSCGVGADAAGTQLYTPLRSVLQAYDALHGTQLWQWHLTHSSVALAQWPVSNGQLTYPLGHFQNDVLTERAVSPAYTWVYDSGGDWQKSTASCRSPLSGTASAPACVSAVMADTLPRQDTKTRCPFNFPQEPEIDSTAVSIPRPGRYAVWSRVMTTGDGATSYYLVVDNTCPIDVGDRRDMPVNEWTWVGYRNGSTGQRIVLRLAAGMHTVKLVGRSGPYDGGLKIDRLVFTSDLMLRPGAQ